MKRYKYGLNGQALTKASFFDLTQIGVHEVSPGDTMSGSFTNRVMSVSTTRLLMNRCYHDVYAFYIPFRLLWEQWPDFIAGDDTVSIPTYTDPVPIPAQIMGSRYDGIEVNEFTLRAYNLIWNKFFRLDSVTESALDDTTVKTAPLRPTTIIERARENLDITDATIDTSGSTITTADVRQAFAQDRFDKTRQFYGSKYTDYLAALGVEASWSILDEPELIGMSQKPLRHKSVDATAEGANTDLGDASGRYVGSVTNRLKRTFVPEHGLIMFIAATRMEIPARSQVGSFMPLKTERDQFYSPEFETQRTEQFECLSTYGTPTATETLTFEKYDNLRYGYNSLVPNLTGFTAYYADREISHTDAVQQIRYPTFSDVDDYFNDTLGGTRLTYACVHRLQRLSPLKPPQFSKGVS
jgi:hypothetical protein